MSTAKEFKDQGNNYVKEKKYKEALECYSKAIELDPNDPILYSNRSLMHINLNEFEPALVDADKAISLKPDYGKGYLRKGKALASLQRTKEALDAYKLGLEKEPGNQQLKDSVAELEAYMNNPFLKNYGKLFTDPRTAGLMQDPQFRNILDFALKDQKILLQMVQTDPRFMSVFSVLTGLDMEKMSEDAQKHEKMRKEEEERKKKEEEERKKKEEEERKKKEEEEKWNNMSPEERKDVEDHKKADEIKAKGNAEYKNKNYDEAIKYYEQAKEIYPKEMTYYLNLSRCYMEKKDYDKSIELCTYVTENTSDFAKRATAFGLMGYAHQSKGNLAESIEFFEKSLLEKSDPRIKDALKEANKLKKKAEEEAYINPEIGEQENTKANELYKAGKYPEALKAYNEAIRRNPKLPKYYTNRASCFIKLLEFSSASKDCEKALELDPTSLRAMQRKANCHLMLKEYHKSLECIEKAQKIYPDDEELKRLYQKTYMAINCSDSQDDEERVKRAYADPEIQRLIQDPRIQQLFKDLKENPQCANEAIMKDEFIAGAFKKLVASGIIKTK